MTSRNMLYAICTAILIIAVGAEDCRFPAHWHGTWKAKQFRGVKDYVITSDKITEFGKCVKTEGDNKFLLVSTGTDSDGRPETCYTCMVFTSRHANVIQYKKGSFCNLEDSDDLMEIVCAHQEVTSNGELETLVRVDAVPIMCPEPLRYSKEFTYDSGQGLCPDEQNSKIYQCASESNVRMNFSPCPSREYPAVDYKFECLASWQNGGGWIFLKAGENDYRCLYYDSTSRDFGMSTDAGCVGLQLVSLAPIFASWMQVNPANRPMARCTYPLWFSDTQWTDLQASFNYRFDQSMRELVVDELSSNEVVQRHTCHQKMKKHRYITEVIDGCSHGYQCVIFKKITETVAELTIGEMVDSPQEACYYNKIYSARSKTTLLTDYNAGPVDCPLDGAYSLKTTPSLCDSSVEVSCTTPSALTVNVCNNRKKELLCSASWSDGDINRLIISDRDSPHRGNCYTYKKNGDEIVLEIDESCNHNSTPIFNTHSLQPPFRLYNRTRNCAGVVGDGSIRNSQSGDEGSGNLAMRSTSQTLHICYGLVIISCLTSVFHRTILISFQSLYT